MSVFSFNVSSYDIMKTEKLNNNFDATIVYKSKPSGSGITISEATFEESSKAPVMISISSCVRGPLF